MKRNLLSVALSLAAAAGPLCAQSTEAGIQGSLVFPQDDLRTATRGRTGFQVGVHEGIYLEAGNELRPRIDYTRIDAGSFSASSLSSTTTVQALSLGVDYLYYFEGARRGLYGVGGVALDWWNTEYRFSGSDRKTSPSLMLGAGHRFNSSWSMEFSLDFGQFRDSMGSASSIKGGVFYRF